MLLLKEMVMVIDIKDRVKSAALQGKIVTASEAALLINPNDKVGISGFIIRVNQLGCIISSDNFTLQVHIFYAVFDVYHHNHLL